MRTTSARKFAFLGWDLAKRLFLKEEPASAISKVAKNFEGLLFAVGDDPRTGGQLGGLVGLRAAHLVVGLGEDFGGRGR